ncbi:MAG: thiolase family protein [Bacteroidetes bacterium]|nr:thiolase family protein [Bacteroidota bacterium]
MKERIAVIDGLRTPFGKAGSALRYIPADDLGAIALRELMYRSPIPYEMIDEVIVGNVVSPIGSQNISRVIALKAGFPISTIAYSVHRNCASGMESISSAALKIQNGDGEIFIAGGAESMSNIPFAFHDKLKEILEGFFSRKSLIKKLLPIFKLRPAHFKPVICLEHGLTDPISNQIMGLTAENLAREFHITREEQDRFAFHSHEKARLNRTKLHEEIFPMPLPPSYNQSLDEDEGLKKNYSMENLTRLKPFFDRRTGSVTIGNSCGVTDGAAFVLLMSESKAKQMKLKPLGFINSFTYAALEPKRMGLGPIYATAKLFKKTGFKITDFDIIEMNEAFASQVIANLIAFSSDIFAKEFLGQDKAVGEIDTTKLNVNGGAIAIGHPVGTTGTRLIITTLKELQRQQKKCGLATLCVGGGQGAAFVVERE